MSSFADCVCVARNFNPSLGLAGHYCLCSKMYDYAILFCFNYEEVIHLMESLTLLQNPVSCCF